jgi:hypothetical protein
VQLVDKLNRIAFVVKLKSKVKKMSKESETDDVKQIVDKATKTTDTVLQPPTTQSQLGIYSKKT